MITVYSEQQALHCNVQEVLSGELIPSFEVAERTDIILRHINARNLGPVIAPHSFTPDTAARVHTSEYVEFLSTAWQQWLTTYPDSKQAMPYCFPVRGNRAICPKHIEGKLGFYSSDLTAALVEGSWQAIWSAAECALTGQQLIQQGERSVFSLCRPPGHHATQDQMGGYCYLNNVAMAAQAYLDNGCQRVAILDVDYHHGNGTQSIFYDRSDVFFTSVHADPAWDYPHFLGYADEAGEGEGQGFNLNLPLALGSHWSDYQPVLQNAINAISNYQPDVLLVSLGLDSYEQDPISFFKLQSDDYTTMGKIIAELKLPTHFVFEGGYAVDALGRNTVNVLEGFKKFGA
ncbi:histone deacetylase family protein [Endozoicomonas ascidiicola]|uniref:histone deacetylase family protein n=1 Tax=Endozoicomonas ascidiicola TaxID=1698521 RepID=UPI0008326DC3|nr:histone deacetylase family protein [Endozoicomonas ascidiicola]